MYSDLDFLAVRNLVFPPMKFSLCFEYKGQQSKPIVDWIALVSPGKARQLSEVLGRNQISVLDDAAENFVFCISAMALLLCRESDSPVFDFPQIISVQQNTEKAQFLDITFGLQNVGLISAHTISNTLVAALDICNWLAQQNSESPLFKKLGLDYLRDLLVRLAGANMPGHPITTKLCHVAHEQSIHYSHLENGVYRFGWGRNAVLFYGSICQSDSSIGMNLSGNKAYTAQILRVAGLSTPEHRNVIDSVAAKNAALSLGFPVVVKPVDCDRGEGVSLDIYDEQTLSAAFLHALNFSAEKNVLVEKQVSGVCHRLFMVKGQLLYAVKRWPPSVFGDGRSNIKQLVEENYQQELLKLPSEQKPLIPWDTETEQFILKSGFNADYVPVMGERVSLRRIESTQWGGYDEDVTHKIHPETLRQVKVACGLLTLSVCGVDVITEDISLPLSQTGGVINELNGGPLLGGGAISRACIPEYLRLLLPNQGKIAVKIFRTAEAEQAQAYLKNELVRGIQCFYCSDTTTLDHHGAEMLESNLKLAQRLRMLIFHPEVESLCIVTDYWAS